MSAQDRATVGPGPATLPGRSRWAARAVALVALLTVLAACGAPASDDEGGSNDEDAAATPERGGTLTVADTAEPASLNPFVALDGASSRVFAQIMEPLYRITADDEVVPWLVEKGTPSQDYMTWTLELREGVTFSDGTPLTADDVVYSLDEVRGSAAWKTMYAEIDSVEATSDSTVVVHTSRPAPALDDSLSNPFATIVPRDLGGLSADEFGREPVGTGPFRVDSWESGQQITLVRNEHYWDPERPYLDELVFKVAPSDSSRAQQLRSGELDVISSPPRPQLTTLEAGSTRVGEYALAHPNYLQLNQQSGPFTDDRLREAADLAVDRQAIIDVAASGWARSGSPSSPLPWTTTTPTCR